MTDFGIQKALHEILRSQRWAMIELWISNACYSKQESGVLNIMSRVLRCSSRGGQGVSKGLETVIEVGRQGKYMYGHGGFS
jgi:hypothetical protein